jgi:hypothetical protein
MNDSQSQTHQIPFFFDRYLSIDQVDLHVEVPSGSNFSEAIVTATWGEPAHLYFQLWMRLIFAAANIGGLALFRANLAPFDRREWAVEQRLTVLLLLVSIIAVNPAYFTYVWEPTVLKELLNDLLFRVWTSFSLTFIWLVIDRLRTQNLSVSFYFPKILFFGLLLLGQVVEGIFSNEWEGLDASVDWVRYVTGLFDAGFLLWFVCLVWLVAKAVDSSEYFKLKVYIAVFLIVIGVGLPDADLAKWVFLNGSGLFTLHFAVLEAFALFMVFSHWTYDYEFSDEFGKSAGQKPAEDIRDFVDSSSS